MSESQFDKRAIESLQELGWEVADFDKCVGGKHVRSGVAVKDPSGYWYVLNSFSEPEAPRYLEWLARGAMGQAKAAVQSPQPVRPTPPRVVPSGRLHRDIARWRWLRKWLGSFRRPRRVDLP